MARSNIPMGINLRQNKNENSHAYLKWYGEVDRKEPINLKGFARHIAEHGKLASFDLIQLVLVNIVDCLKEMLSQGQPVKLDGLGTFSPSIENIKGGAVKLEKALEMGPQALIAGVKINFLPEGEKDQKLTSRAFKDECVFEYAYVVEAKEKTVDGKKVKYQERIPVASYAAHKATVDGAGD